MPFSTNTLNFKFIDSGSNKSQVLILEHGRGGRLPLMEFFAKRSALSAGEKKFDFLIIEAPHPEFVPEMKVPGFSWFDIKSKDLKGLQESRSKLRALLQELEAYGYRRDKIFWIGFSQGCVMGLDLVLRAEEPIGGLVGVSGFCLRPEAYPAEFGKAAKETPILLTAGTRDEIVPPGPAIAGFQHLEKLGVRLEIREYNKPHSFDLKKEIPEIESWLLEKI